jgi:hypothetical protein
MCAVTCQPARPNYNFSAYQSKPDQQAIQARVFRREPFCSHLQLRSQAVPLVAIGTTCAVHIYSTRRKKDMKARTSCCADDSSPRYSARLCNLRSRSSYEETVTSKGGAMTISQIDSVVCNGYRVKGVQGRISNHSPRRVATAASLIGAFLFCCCTARAHGDDCQDLSDAYGISAGSTWGFAPQKARDYWNANSCQTRPSSNRISCQVASDLYGISARSSWGFAPEYVKAWWVQNNCQTVSKVSACQIISDRYGTKGNGTWGFAPLHLRQWWSFTGCSTSTDPTPRIGRAPVPVQ